MLFHVYFTIYVDSSFHHLPISRKWALEDRTLLTHLICSLLGCITFQSLLVGRLENRAAYIIIWRIAKHLQISKLLPGIFYEVHKKVQVASNIITLQNMIDVTDKTLLLLPTWVTSRINHVIQNTDKMTHHTFDKCLNR